MNIKKDDKFKDVIHEPRHIPYQLELEWCFDFRNSNLLIDTLELSVKQNNFLLAILDEYFEVVNSVTWYVHAGLTEDIINGTYTPKSKNSFYHQQNNKISKQSITSSNVDNKNSSNDSISKQNITSSNTNDNTNLFIENNEKKDIGKDYKFFKMKYSNYLIKRELSEHDEIIGYSFKKLKNINSKQNSKQGDQNLLVKTKEVSKVKRSSLVNFKPTNIDINSIPNINATTTTNTILNSSSPYREEKGQMSNRKGIVIHDLNHADGVPDSILNSSSPFREGKDQNVKRKGIIIRDLNNADGICYEIKINSSEESDEKGENSSKTALSNNDNINTIENNDGSSSSSSTVSFSLNNSNNKRTGRKYSHKRQNSVRLEISY